MSTYVTYLLNEQIKNGPVLRESFLTRDDHFKVICKAFCQEMCFSMLQSINTWRKFCQWTQKGVLFFGLD